MKKHLLVSVAITFLLVACNENDLAQLNSTFWRKGTWNSIYLLLPPCFPAELILMR